MIVRQSMLKTWQSCPEKVRFELEGHPRKQSCALTFGSVIHAAVEVLEARGLQEALTYFEWAWNSPEQIDPTYKIDYYLNGRTWLKYRTNGRRILSEWAALYAWNTDVVLAREHFFEVPIGDGHTLRGTADKVSIRNGVDGPELVVGDYKTNATEPTYEWLEDDLQFTAYCWASTRPEFWATFSDGQERWLRYQDLPRRGEWVQLTAPKVKSAGLRGPQQYNRLIRAVNQLARSVESGIYVPTLSGASCKWCDFREMCGLPDVEGTLRNPSTASQITQE